MQRRMCNQDRICFPPTYVIVVSTRPLIEYKYKMHGHVEINQYEIMSLFVITKYTWVSRIIILDYEMVTHIMPYIRYK